MPKKYVLIISGFSFLKILIHFAANANYGLHADELYYIALGKHLQWGYLDTSPFIVFTARLSAWLFGESTFAYRIFPTLISAANVFLTGLLTFYFGGRKLAISITCMAMICSPVLLATGYFLQPVAFEQFFWTAGIFLLVRYIQTNRPVFLYGCAVVFGLGVLNKYTILLYAFAVFAGLVIAFRNNNNLRWKHILPAFFMSALIILPNFIWQANHHFPVINYLAVVKEHTGFKGTGDYLFQYIFFHGAGMAVWMAGLGFLIFSPRHRLFRFAAWAFIITSITLVGLQGKIYYGIGAFPVLFAAGGVCWESMLDKAAAFWRYNLFVMLILPVLIALPVVLPILPFSLTLRYFKLMTTYTNITQPLRWEDGKTHQISQFYADMFGWQELTRKAQQAVLLLDKKQRKQAVILTESYAIAGALTYYGKTEISTVISPTNSFILWSPENLTAENVIYISRKKTAEISKLAEKVRLTGIVTHKYAYEKGTKIYLLYKPSAQLKEGYTNERNRFLQP